ncbi:hypothetical protein DY000_02031237 [Brassica cretica]|uniref:Uncharacterized protein n=1 Tax=Brassica cretica TaxID=69181 RepID=A0ABQ7DYD2_BRACR|nr:hypothetical protein DY000_02031237 [Brassica cretica]
MDLTISALTSKVEAIQGELVEIQSYIARRPEASISTDRRINKSIDTNHSASIDIDTNRGRLVPKTTSDMSNKPYHGKEISADTYAALSRNQFNLESLGERLQRIENTTAAMKDKWRRGDEAMRDFTELSRAEEAESSYPTSASITTTTSTSIDTSTATSIDSTTSTSSDGMTSTSTNGTTSELITHTIPALIN